MSTRTLTRRGAVGRRAPARAPQPPARRADVHTYDRTGERVDQLDDVDEALVDEHSPDPIRCRFGAIIAVDMVCCWRWPHP